MAASGAMGCNTSFDKPLAAAWGAYPAKQRAMKRHAPFRNCITWPLVRDAQTLPKGRALRLDVSQSLGRQITT
jgi:hypothetical protein